MPTSALIFDLDMTLVDSSQIEPYRRAGKWDRVLAEINRVQPFRNKTGVAPHELPGKLRKLGYAIGIVTSSPRHYAERVLRNFGIPYDALIAYHDTERHKPDPEPLQLALRSLKVTPDDVYSVGDAADDVRASYRAGITSVGVGWAFSGDHDPTLRSYIASAPDILIWTPNSLLQPDLLHQRRYLAEVEFAGETAIHHIGSYFRWKEGRRAWGCSFGRYFNTSDPRLAGSRLSQSLLRYKNDDTDALRMAQLLGRFFRWAGWVPDMVLSVPPKPDEDDRFATLLQNLAEYLPDHIIEPNALTCLRTIEGYKAMGQAERETAVRGAYECNVPCRGKAVVIDDVHTTGATSRECAQLVIANGATDVVTITFGLSQHSFERKLCPKCNRPMKQRTNSRTGVLFWSCSAYPQCKTGRDV